MRGGFLEMVLLVFSISIMIRIFHLFSISIMSYKICMEPFDHRNGK